MYFAFSFNLKHQLNTEFLYKNNLPHTVMAKFQKELFKISEIVYCIGRDLLYCMIIRIESKYCTTLSQR